MEVSERFLNNTYSSLAQEQSRLLNEMKSNPEMFKQNEKLHSTIGTIMKDILKLKNLKEKIRISS